MARTTQSLVSEIIVIPNQLPASTLREEPINPPVDQGTGQDEQHSQPSTDRDKESVGLEGVQTDTAKEERQQEQKASAQPKKRHRPKKICTWIKANFFNIMLTVFTGLYAFGFLFDAYITKRAYITPGFQDKRAVSILPGDVGVEILLRNTGQTPVKRYLVQGWVLKEKRAVPIEDPSPYAPQHSISPGYSIRVSLRWPDAPLDISRIRKGEMQVGVLWRIAYQDAFYIWHCEELAARYEHLLEEGFAGTSGPRICDSTTRSVRFNRVCVPSADKTFGVWVETWESFRETVPTGSTPENDPTPCQPRTQHEEQTEEQK